MSHTDNEKLNIKWEELSPAIQQLASAFDSNRNTQENNSLLVYYDMWQSTIHLYAVAKDENPWCTRDRLEQDHPDMFHTILMMLDLKKSFFEQMPARFLKALERFDCFAQNPLVCVSDHRQGFFIQEQERSICAAIWPKPHLCASNPQAPITPRQKRLRDHLSLVE